MQHACCLSLPLFCTTTTLFCSYTLILWTNCRMCLPNILSPVFMLAFIFHCRSFLPCWPLAFLIFSPPLWIFMFLFLRNSSPLFSITRSSSFSVIHVSVNIKNNAEKDTTLGHGHVITKFSRMGRLPHSTAQTIEVKTPPSARKTRCLSHERG